MAGADPIEIVEQIRAFGNNLRAARARAGLTQAQLSKAAPLDRAAISRLECGERSPDMPTLLRVCAALSTTPAELLRGVGAAAVGRGLPRAATEASASQERFGANLRMARQRAGISQEQLALDAKVDRAAISVYENGVRQPNLRTVLKLAGKLDIAPSALLRGVGADSGADRAAHSAATAKAAEGHLPRTTARPGAGPRGRRASVL